MNKKFDNGKNQNFFTFKSKFYFIQYFFWKIALTSEF